MRKTSDFVALARQAIEEYVKSGKIISIPENLPPQFYKKKGGVFVSVHRGDELRGCVGTYLPVHKNLAEEVIMNAVAACSKDFRFNPVTIEELPLLSIEVSLLNKPEKISNLGELDPKKYGVIVKCPDGRCGLLLPCLKGIDSVDQQLTIACQKGGINPSLEKKLEIFKFSVEKYSQ